MTVKELRQRLNELPDDMVIIIQKDREGNNYSPMSGADSNVVYVPINGYSGIAYSLHWTYEDACMSHGEWEILKTMPRSLILYPYN